jgi:hypothetical protein
VLTIGSGASLWTADLADPDVKGTKVADMPAPYFGLKAVSTPDGDINFLLTCLAYPNGTAYNEELAVVPPHTGQLYDSM